MNSGTKIAGEKSHIAEVYKKGKLFICLQWNLHSADTVDTDSSQTDQIYFPYLL